MKRISIYFVDGKSLAFSISDEEYQRLATWVEDEKNNSPYRMIYNNIEHFIFKNAIEYILA